MGKHSTWRKQAKYAQRKRKRQAAALKRVQIEAEEQKQREQTPLYQLWLKEQQQLEEFQLAEELRISNEQESQYQLREKEAKEKWEVLQKKLQRAQAVRALQNIKIKAEWEAEQARLKALKEEKARLEEEQLLNEKKLQEQIDAFLNNNAEMPDELSTILETNPGKMTCPFFSRTGACRFGDMCSRNHKRPTISSTLLIKNFYSHYSLDAKENEHGDLSLEFEHQEIYKHFKEFFDDVMPEFEAFGELQQLKVCCNKEAHLRGNVYVEYESAREAMKSYRRFQGRFYGGRQLNVEFCLIASWKSAICGLFHRRCCPKGSGCNFLHVFRNPGNVFMRYDNSTRGKHVKTVTHHRKAEDWNKSERKDWRWSSSPEIEALERPASDRLKQTEYFEKDERNLTRQSERCKSWSYRRSRSRSKSRRSSSRSSSRKSDKMRCKKRHRSRSRSGSSSRRKHEKSDESSRRKSVKRR